MDNFHSSVENLLFLWKTLAKYLYPVEKHLTYPQVYPQVENSEILNFYRDQKVFHNFHNPYYYYKNLNFKNIQEVEQFKKIQNKFLAQFLARVLGLASKFEKDLNLKNFKAPNS